MSGQVPQSPPEGSLGIGETGFFTGRKPFMLPDQQCHSTEGMCQWMNERVNDIGVIIIIVIVLLI